MYYGYGYGYGMDPWYILVIIAFLFSMVAQTKVSSTFNKYSRVRNRAGFTGAQVAAQMLQNAGIYDVSVQRVAGNLTDHYDPRTNVIRLSDSVYSSTSTAAIGVACHEAGHAVQYAENYAPIKLRAAIIPLTNFGSRIAMPLILAGILLTAFGQFSDTLVYLGIAAFGMSLVFQIVTLPVEFNASHRAIDRLVDDGFLASDEIGGAKKVLSAAAMTYVAAAFAAVAQLLRLIAIFGRRDD